MSDKALSLAKHMAHLMGGNGLSTDQSIVLMAAKLEKVFAAHQRDIDFKNGRIRHYMQELEEMTRRRDAIACVDIREDYQRGEYLEFCYRVNKRGLRSLNDPTRLFEDMHLQLVEKLTRAIK